MTGRAGATVGWPARRLALLAPAAIVLCAATAMTTLAALPHAGAPVTATGDVCFEARA